MATSTSHLPPLLPAPTSPHHLHLHLHPSPSTPHRCFHPLPPIRLLRAARRRHLDAVVVAPDARPWVGDLSEAAYYRDGIEEDEDDAEEDEDEDRSLDLLARFLHAVFRKASRRARRAARSVLPPSVPAELVKFSVNGVLVLTFLWILKGLLEVVCTFGSMVFASILFVRGIWSGVTYIRENRHSYIHQLNNYDNRWSRVQTAG